MREFKKLPPASRPIAFLSDIEGNLRALEAVLKEIETYNVEQVYVAGDLVFGGEDPLGVFQRLLSLKAICTKGLTDYALVSLDPESLQPANDEEAKRAALFIETRRRLGDLNLERIRRLPFSFRIPMIDGREILMVHGTPSDPHDELTHDLSDDELLEKIGDDVADIIVCGASHIPFQANIGEQTVVNVGSVGAAPGGSIAHYTILTPKMSGTEILQSFIEY